jgi:erythromycin esterase-like protein
LLTWHSNTSVGDVLRDPRLERAIGVIYRPETERMSHYFQARLPQRFDAVLHFCGTTSGRDPTPIPD